MIRWIRARLGTVPYDALGHGDWYVLDVRHLVDRSGNTSEAIEQLIDEGAQKYREGVQVVVACDLGISRSNAIAAGIISRLDGVTFDQAIVEVVERTHETELKLDFVESVRSALSPRAPRSSRNAILVTGANGFLGRHAIERLSKQFSVLAPARNDLDLTHGAVALGDYCIKHNICQILHLAYPRHYTNTAAAASGLALLRTVLDVCRTYELKLIFVSSSDLYRGYATTEMIADETTPMRPVGVSSETKYLEEMLVDLYFRRGEIERTICRFSPVYGPGGDRPRFIKTFYQAAIEKQMIRTHRYHNGRPALDLLYVSDAIDAISLAMSYPESEIFHLGSGRLVSTAECAEMIGRIVGVTTQVEEVKISEYVGNIAFAADKAKRLLGWTARVSLEEGLSATLRSYGVLRI